MPLNIAATKRGGALANTRRRRKKPRSKARIFLGAAVISWLVCFVEFVENKTNHIIGGFFLLNGTISFATYVALSEWEKWKAQDVEVLDDDEVEKLDARR